MRSFRNGIVIGPIYFSPVPELFRGACGAAARREGGFARELPQEGERCGGIWRLLGNLRGSKGGRAERSIGRRDIHDKYLSGENTLTAPDEGTPCHAPMRRGLSPAFLFVANARDSSVTRHPCAASGSSLRAVAEACNRVSDRLKRPVWCISGSQTVAESRLRRNGRIRFSSSIFSLPAS